MRKRVVGYTRIPEFLLDRLRGEFDVTYFEKVTDANRADFAAAVSQAHGTVGAGVKWTPALLDPARHLEAMATVSVGYDAFDVDDLTRRGILLTNTPDVLTETTADLIFTLVLAAARRIVDLAVRIRDGEWTKPVDEAWFGTDVHGKTLGIVGMGRIGQAVARRARFGFNMDILYHNRSRHPEVEAAMGARLVPLDDLLRASDFVCVVVPLSAATRHLIGAREFALMKPGGIFVNGGRGPVVDEAALVDALRGGTIRAAGLDVFEQEPLPLDSPLRALRNVVAVPHIGSATVETRQAMAELAVANLIAALRGERPRSLVNDAAWQARQSARPG